MEEIEYAIFHSKRYYLSVLSATSICNIIFICGYKTLGARHEKQGIKRRKAKWKFAKNFIKSTNIYPLWLGNLLSSPTSLPWKKTLQASERNWKQRRRSWRLWKKSSPSWKNRKQKWRVCCRSWWHECRGRFWRSWNKLKWKTDFNDCTCHQKVGIKNINWS